MWSRLFARRSELQVRPLGWRFQSNSRLVRLHRQFRSLATVTELLGLFGSFAD